MGGCCARSEIEEGISKGDFLKEIKDKLIEIQKIIETFSHKNVKQEKFKFNIVTKNIRDDSKPKKIQNSLNLSYSQQEFYLEYENVFIKLKMLMEEYYISTNTDPLLDDANHEIADESGSKNEQEEEEDEDGNEEEETPSQKITETKLNTEQDTDKKKENNKENKIQFSDKFKGKEFSKIKAEKYWNKLMEAEDNFNVKTLRNCEDNMMDMIFDDKK